MADPVIRRKGRRKFRNRLAHDFDSELDPRYIYPENGLPQEVSQRIQRLLKDSGWNGTSKCYVMSEHSDWDGIEATLEEAKEGHDGLHGMIVTVIPGRLAYYWTEDPNYVLFRTIPPNGCKVPVLRPSPN